MLISFDIKEMSDHGNELQEMGIKTYIRKPFAPEQVSSPLISVLGEWNESRSC